MCVPARIASQSDAGVLRQADSLAQCQTLSLQKRATAVEAHYHQLLTIDTARTNLET